MSPSLGLVILFGGYLVGSLSPSYFLGRLKKKIDIRKHGTGNAGTVNAYKVLGLGPAVLTAVFDLGKGLGAMHAARLLGASPWLAYGAGAAAVLGHVFPFYLNFRGGQGVATATALLLYHLAIFIIQGWFPWPALLLLAFYTLSFALVCRRGELVGTAVLPVLGLLMVLFAPDPQRLFFALSFAAYILFINLRNALDEGLLKARSAKAKSMLNWRHHARPFALLLVVDYLKAGKRDALLLTAGITLFFLILDLSRLFSSRVNLFFFAKVKELYKSKEARKFSSITLFLLSGFLTFLLFERSIAAAAVTYLIFGDFFSKFFGILFGRTRLFEKTLEGSLAHFNACLVSGYVLSFFLPLSVPVYLVGAAVATTAEFLPLGIDDNFSVALLSASAMYLIQHI